jgi:hypothetical protein
VGAVLVADVSEAGLLLNYIERGSVPAKLVADLRRRSAFASHARAFSTQLWL